MVMMGKSMPTSRRKGGKERVAGGMLSSPGKKVLAGRDNCIQLSLSRV